MRKQSYLCQADFICFGQIRLITILYKSKKKHIENILKSTKHVEKQ